MTEHELLQRYAQDRSEEAFTELVGRHAGWVYASALRQVGERHIAEDVTQAVFMALAQKAGTLHGGVKLATWLFQVTRYAAAKAVRAEGRRREHERKAAAMRQEAPILQDALWEEIAPLLDPLVSRLRSADQQAVLLRFYQQKSMAEVGEGLGVSEEAAKKRVGRAVERLREMFTGRGISAESVSLGAALVAHAAAPVGPGLVSSTAAAALAGAKTAGAVPAVALAKGAVNMMAAAKVKVAVAAVVLVTTAGGAGVVLVGATSTTRPKPMSATDASMPATPQVVGEYYVGGDVPRNGVYSLSRRRITLRQALVSAGADLGEAKVLSLIRRGNSGGPESMLTISLPSIIGDRDILVQANDVLQVMDAKPADSPIYSGDELEISIGDLTAPKVTTTFTRDVAGKEHQVYLPLVPPVEVKGLTPKEAEAAISRAYHDANLIQKADVQVIRVEPTGQWRALGKLHKGESVLLRIWDLEAPDIETRRTLQIDAEGRITPPRLSPMPVAGMEEYEAEKMLAGAYKDARIIPMATLAIERISVAPPQTR